MSTSYKLALAGGKELLRNKIFFLFVCVLLSCFEKKYDKNYIVGRRLKYNGGKYVGDYICFSDYRGLTIDTNNYILKDSLKIGVLKSISQKEIVFLIYKIKGLSIYSIK